MATWNTWAYRLMSQQQNRLRDNEDKKYELLSDPVKLDKMVAAYTRSLSPAVKIRNEKDYALPTQAVEASIPSDHAMRGYSQQVKESFTRLISNPELRGFSPEELLHAVGQTFYMTPKRGDQVSRYERSLEYKRKADTAWFGAFGEEELVAKPAKYDQWREMVSRIEEGKGSPSPAGIAEFPYSVAKASAVRRELGQEGWLPSLKGVGTSAAWWGGGEALLGALGWGTAGELGALVAGPIGAIAGTAVSAATHPIKRYIHGTEWARARMHSDKVLDSAKLMMADLGVELPLIGRSFGLAKRLATVPVLAKAGKQTAERVLFGEALTRDAQRGLDRRFLTESMSREYRTAWKLGRGWESNQELKDILKMATPYFWRKTHGGGWLGRVVDPRRAVMRPAGLLGTEYGGFTPWEPEWKRMLPPPEEGKVVRPTAAEPPVYPKRGVDIPGIGAAQEAPVREYYVDWRRLDEIGADEALSHPAGPVVGAAVALERQSKRELITGIVPMETAEKAIVQASKPVLREQRKAAKDAYAELDKWLSIPLEERMPGYLSDLELTGQWKELRARYEELRTRLESRVLPTTVMQERGLTRTLPGRVEYGSIQAEMADVRGQMAMLELQLDPGVRELLRNTTSLSAAEMEHGIARTPLSQLEAEALDAAVAALRAGAFGTSPKGFSVLSEKAVENAIARAAKKGKKLTREEYFRNLFGRTRYGSARRAEELYTAEGKLRGEARKYLKYKIDESKSPGTIAKEMEGLSEREAYYTISEYDERLWNRHMEGKSYTEVKTGPKAEERAVDYEIEGQGKKSVYETVEEPRSGEEILTEFADMTELEAKMSPEEHAIMDAAVNVHQRKEIEAGVEVAGRRFPRTRSTTHYYKVSELKDLRDGFSGPRAIPGSQVEAEAAATTIGQNLHVTEEDARRLMGEIAKLDDAGVSNAELIHMVTRLDESIGASPNLTNIQKSLLREGMVMPEDFTGPTASLPTSTGAILAQLKKRQSMLAFFAMLGVSPALFNLFLPDTAEASPYMSIAGVAAREFTERVGLGATVKMMRELFKAGHIVEQVADPKKMNLGLHEFMRGLSETAYGGPKTALKSISTLSKDVKLGVRHRFYGPYSMFEEAMNIGKHIMNNPAVFRATYQAAEYMNRTNAEFVLTNMIRESGVKAQPMEIAARFSHLVPFMERQFGYEFHSARIKDIGEELTKLRKGGGKLSKEMRDIDIANAEAKLAESVNFVREHEGAIPAFHQEWARVAEQAARDIPSVRVYLSVWDGPEFKRAPFMTGISMSPEEQVLAGRVREQLLVYKKRLEEQGVQTISGPYMPVAMHPDFKRVFKGMTAGDERAAAYMRFFRRSPHSRPLLPGTETSMLYYIGDTERRLQNRAFWKSDWASVEARTTHIPVIAKAFEALREGVKPTEMTPGNKLASIYVQLEAMKRLWLNPSAGGKHAMKMTGTMATLGYGISLKQIPTAAKHVMRRFMDLSERTLGVLGAAGVRGTSAKNKIVDSFLHSMIPARNARHRLLDMGIHAEEEWFSTWRALWHRGQNVGATWINMAEVIDRGVSALGGLEMAAKKGLTAEQAYYGSWELIVKNNFLSREFNPEWLRNPKAKALFMFQGTPWKILERRVVQAVRTGRALKKNGRAIFNATKTHEGRVQLLQDLRNLGKDMRSAENELKVNLIADSLRSETDFFGTPVVYQFAKDILTMGAVIGGGASAGANLKHHIFHIPFVSGMTSDPTVAFSPGILAAWRFHNAWQKGQYEDQDWLFVKFLQKWLGPTWLAPDIFWKYARITRSDIPDLYKDSKFKYLFAIPAKERY